ncbi:FliH/SctL family protein [Escherichia coli]
MQQLVSEFQTTLDELDSVIASRLMQMALEAGRQVIGQTPTVDNSAPINRSNSCCSNNRYSAVNHSWRVHPDDSERVDDMLGATLSLHGWRLRGDPALHPAAVKSPPMKAIPRRQCRHSLARTLPLAAPALITTRLGPLANHAGEL